MNKSIPLIASPFTFDIVDSMKSLLNKSTESDSSYFITSILS